MRLLARLNGAGRKRPALKSADWVVYSVMTIHPELVALIDRVAANLVVIDRPTGPRKSLRAKASVLGARVDRVFGLDGRLQRFGPFPDQVSQSVDHRSARRLRGFVHPSVQPLRSAVHHIDGAGRLRPLPRQLDSFFQRAGTTRASRAYCQKARRWRNACRLNGITGRCASRRLRVRRPSACTI
jgi:hypothetical protein